MKLFHKFGAWISALPILLLPATAFAAVEYKGLQGSQTSLGDVKAKLTDTGNLELPQLIGGIINVFLGVLGIIFVIYTVYAGILWMTAGGKPDNVTKAKEMLKNAIVGIIIIVAAYAISNFVISQIITATKA